MSANRFKQFWQCQNIQSRIRQIKEFLKRPFIQHNVEKVSSKVSRFTQLIGRSAKPGFKSFGSFVAEETSGLFQGFKEMLYYSNESDVETMRATRVFFYVLIALMFALYLWLRLSALDVVSTVKGQLAPSSDIKSIQHLEGGIIDHIYVHPGELVKKDQVLITLNAKAAGATALELENRIAALQADIYRLSAEAISTQRNPKEPQFPELFMQKNGTLVSEALGLFKIRQSKHFNEMQGNQDRIEQRQQELEGITARLRNFKMRYQLIQEQVAISEELLREELTNRYNHLELLREASSVLSAIEEDQSGQKRASAALQEAIRMRDGVRNGYLEEVAAQLNDSNKQLVESQDRLVKIKDALDRMTITAPVDGIIKDIYFNVAGAVVRSGETLVDLVPADDTLVVEARMSVSDVGYVTEHQRATIRLASGDAMRYDALDGEVIYIAPDTTKDPATGEYFYKVKIRPKQDHFKVAGSSTLFKQYPGMQVNANIVIGRRVVLEYILSPFLNSSYGALQER
ncbi:MAG: HlyD family type I secretion periplasmic adaptor subunit [Pseudomonadota bacterium]